MRRYGAYLSIDQLHPWLVRVSFFRPVICGSSVVKAG